MTTATHTDAPDGRDDLTAEAKMRRAWKDADQLPDQIIKEAQGVIIKTVSEEEMRRTRTIPFRVSTPAVDRAWGGGDVVVPTGGRFENFLKSPVILWAHSHFTPPIGRGANVRADASGVYMDKTFIEQEISPFANTIFEMLVRGYLNACSIGFRPLKYMWNEERGSWAADYIEWELLESSICAVGMNPDALQVARSVGLDLAPLREFAERVLEEELARGGDDVQRRLHERFLKHSTSRGAQVQTRGAGEIVVKLDLGQTLNTFSDQLKALESKIDQINARAAQLGERGLETQDKEGMAAGGGQQDKAQDQGETTPPSANTTAAESDEDGTILIVMEE